MFHGIFIWILINTNVVVMNFGRKCVCGWVWGCNKAAISHFKIDIVKRIAIRKCVL